jgi:hypothetical protein
VARHEAQLGEEPAHFVDERDLLWREAYAWPGHTGGRAERDVELDALHVDRIEHLVVQRDLRVQARGERVHCAQLELVREAIHLPQRLHALVRVDADAREEEIGEIAHCALAGLVLDADHGLGDAVRGEDRPQHRDRVFDLVGIPLRDVLEHVARGELDRSFACGGVERRLPDELVERVDVFARLWEPHRGVDDTSGLGRGVRLRGGHRSSPNNRSAFSRRNFGHT